jgi:hypothetical protein
LIDQLDAVSELLDRKSQRLNLLLSLIQRLSGSKNVHIIATCREFEFRYGSQFARLAEIDHLFLKLPTWEEIASILELAGHQPAGLGEPLRELLQNPLHLNIFLAVARSGDVFTSFQNLLDRLWEERVKKQPNTEECITFLEKLADRMTEEEERALPWFDLRRSSGIIRGGTVGPRMTKDEMFRADDQHLINLFNELSDQTQWDAPSRKWSDDFSRAGGAIQQSLAFGELVKDDPARFLRILPQLKPQQHESYVGEALKHLAETDFSANDLIRIIADLDRRGFVSEGFRSEAAHALEKIAERHQGLPPSSLSLLEGWLANHSQPEPLHYSSKEEQTSNLKSPILYGIGGSHILPSGRGNIVRAIAEGYLKQDPPDLAGWAKFIRSQLGVEPHPAVWVDILTRMPPLLNGDRIEATQLFNQVIRNCPEILQYAWALYFISRTIGWFEPKETVQGWLEMLKSNPSNFSQQAYGELLLIQYLQYQDEQYQDEWSVEQIHYHLATQDNEALLCGLAHAASHLWIQRRCRTIAAEILYTLASSSKTSVYLSQVYFDGAETSSG